MTSPPAPGVLLVVPSDARDLLPTTTVAGLPLLDRIAVAANRAGVERVVVPDERGAKAAGVGRSEGRRRVIVLAADVVPRVPWLRALLARPIEPETLYTDGAGVAMIESEDAGRLLADVARARTLAEALGALGRRVRRVPLAVDASDRFQLGDARRVPEAESWLLRGLVKEYEGFMSRHVERRISLAITRRLARTPLTPNAVTLGSLAIGVLAAPFFLSGSPWYQLAGALLFLLHSIVDGCDGELARLKFLESRAGAVLDFWGDNVVHLAVFGCMAVGWSLEARAVWPLVLGVVSLGSTLGAAASVARFAMRDRRPGDPRSLSGRVIAALAHRDFIYVVVLLAAIGKAWWFLVPSAAGTPLFLLLLLVSGPRGEPIESR